MKKKVLIIGTSPRLHGNTNILDQSFSKEARRIQSRSLSQKSKIPYLQKGGLLESSRFFLCVECVFDSKK